MKNQQKPAGQVISLAKPPQYWLRRAQQHRRQGEHHRAAALLRHAVTLEPASGDLRMEYAKSLRDMNCYEASNREAFGVLALQPSEFLPYQIIGQNMLSLGREQEAVDAFSHYLEQAHALPESALIDPFDDSMDVMENFWDSASQHGKTRLMSLCHIAALRLARGDMTGAEKALKRAEKHSSHHKRLLSLKIRLLEARGLYTQALAQAQLTVSRYPYDLPALCSLANIQSQLGNRGLAAAALMKAAFACRFPHEEQLLCFTAAALHMPEIALSALQLSNRTQPCRLPTLLNCAVILLQMGNGERASGFLHRCLELDPKDLSVQSLYQDVQGWQLPLLSPNEIKEKAKKLSFYPFLSADATNRLLREVGDAFALGVDALALRLETDTAFYHQYLQALFLPSAPLSRLILPVAASLKTRSTELALRLLRDILLASAPCSLAKQHALSALITLGAPPPYILWQNGRILHIRFPEDSPKASSALQRHLLRRVHRLSKKTKDSRLIPHALTLLYRLNHHFCCVFAADQGRIWSTALLRHFSLTYGLALFEERFIPGTFTQSERAFAKLCAVMPLP